MATKAYSVTLIKGHMLAGQELPVKADEISVNGEFLQFLRNGEQVASLKFSSIESVAETSISDSVEGECASDASQLHPHHPRYRSPRRFTLGIKLLPTSPYSHITETVKGPKSIAMYDTIVSGDWMGLGYGDKLLVVKKDGPDGEEIYAVNVDQVKAIAWFPNRWKLWAVDRVPVERITITSEFDVQVNDGN